MEREVPKAEAWERDKETGSLFNSNTPSMAKDDIAAGMVKEATGEAEPHHRTSGAFAWAYEGTTSSQIPMKLLARRINPSTRPS